MTVSFPNPAEGFCGKCKFKQLFVPIYRKTKDEESLTWKCSECGQEVPP